MSAFTFIIFIAFSVYITSAANVPNFVRYIANDDDVPESCRNLTYCTVKPANYPEEEFGEMFKNFKLFPQPQFVEPTELIADRFGESESNCHSEPSYEPLYKVRERKDEPWYYVIQAPKPNVVRIRMETCSFPGEKCFGSECASSVVKPTCNQVVNTWQIPVFKDGKPTTVKTDLPVCCKCTAASVPFTTKEVGPVWTTK